MLWRMMLKKRGLGINLLACCGFLMLAVFAWGLPLSTLLSYLLVIVGLLVAAIGVAALAGYLLRRLLSRKD